MTSTLTNPFLTALDPRAAVKGSRDPLGLVPLWSDLGRDVVGNLTTVTNSFRGFTTLMLAQWLADEAIARGHGEEAERCNFFLRAEQVINYSRVVGLGEEAQDSGRILGITRLRRRCSPARPKLRISKRPEYQILADQKVYGLWGLFSVSARNSGLSEPDCNRPSEMARELIETQYLPMLETSAGAEQRKLVSLVKEWSMFEPVGRHADLSHALAELMRPEVSAAERDLYHPALVLGEVNDITSGRQARLWRLMEELNDGDGPFSWEDEYGAEELAEGIKRSRAAGDDELAECLERILVIEPVLVAAAAVFGLLIERDGQTLKHVASELDGHWAGGLSWLRADAVEGLRPRLARTMGEQGAARLAHLAVALQAGDHGAVLRLCLEQNDEVMGSRGAAAWVDVREETLHVRLRQDRAAIPSAEEMRTAFRNPYFIDSLKRVGAEINQKRAR